MADRTDKPPDNVPGKYYNDRSCCDCDLCRYTAPTVFQRNDEGGYTYVFHQPETPEELELTQQAMEECPTDSIGDDGDLE